MKKTYIRMKWAYKGIETTEKELAVAVDILRASTIITRVLHYDDEWIMPTLSIKKARILSKEYKTLRNSKVKENIDLTTY